MAGAHALPIEPAAASPRRMREVVMDDEVARQTKALIAEAA